LGKGKPFIFHSTNPWGVDRMVNLLNSNGRTLIKAPMNIVRTMSPVPTYWSLVEKHILNK